MFQCSIDVKEPSFVVCFLQLLYGLYHCLIEFILLLTICNIFVFSWFFLLEHMFLCDSAFGSNIYIYYIHIYSYHIFCYHFFLKSFFAYLQIWDNLSSCAHSNHIYGMHMSHSLNLLSLNGSFHHCYKLAGSSFFFILTCLHCLLTKQ